MHRSITRNSASEQNTLAIDDSWRACPPWSSTHAACQMTSRARCMSSALSASMNPTPSCSASALPNASRRTAYPQAMSWARFAAPSHRMQWVSRAGASRTWAYR